MRGSGTRADLPGLDTPTTQAKTLAGKLAAILFRLLALVTRQNGYVRSRAQEGGADLWLAGVELRSVDSGVRE
jgi:hypothetical protein